MGQIFSVENSTKIKNALEKAVSIYLTSNNVNDRSRAGNTLFMELKPMLLGNSKSKVSQLLDPFIQRLKKIESQHNNDTSCDARVLSLLGLLYRLKLNFTQAIYYLELASTKNEANAIFLRGYLYQAGLLGRTDMKKAMECYEQAAKFNHAVAINNLAGLYCEKENRDDHSDDEIIGLFFKAAQLGNPEAIKNFNAIKEQSFYINESFSQEFSQPNIEDKECMVNQTFTVLAGWDSGGGLFKPTMHTLQFPHAFSQLNTDAKAKLLKLVEKKVQDIYYQHTIAYYKTIKETGHFEAEELKNKFDADKNYIVQNAVNEICKQCLVVDIKNHFSMFSQKLKDQTLTWLQIAKRMQDSKISHHLAPPRPLLMEIANLSIAEDEKDKVINTNIEDRLQKLTRN